ncbi:DNA2/NAM7 family helicase [Paenibacillus sp. TRM 82003]|nr:DNA2/NAM7 family helicase [Paenibacillus sp. TRM 82003]
MTREEAFRLWNEHWAKWSTFLHRVKQEHAEGGDIPALVKTNRQIRALSNVKYGAVASPELFFAFIHPEANRRVPQKRELSFYDTSLNASQQDAVTKAMAAERLALIQGPPGTGKTTVITEICLQVLLSNPSSRILICSETHVAVNNVLEKLYQKLDNFTAFRIRNKENHAHPDIEQSELDSLLDQYYGTLAAHGIPEQTVDMLKTVFSDESKRSSVEKDIMQSRRVVGVTCNGVGAYTLLPQDSPFDYVIIDEVCKATLPEIVMPMTWARKAVLVGDPNQLPPLFCREENEFMEQTGTREVETHKYVDSLFERMPEHGRSMLDKQFRMTDEIGDIVSRFFYKGQLKNGLKRPVPGSVLWADYSSPRRWPVEEGMPITNDDEGDIVQAILALEANRIPSGERRSAAIISPYRPFVRNIRKKLQEKKGDYASLDIQVDTIDAFQGKDADLVVFCMTRNAGTMRFFSDMRRLNVALSRAKHKLWIVGSRKYTDRHPLLRQLSDNIETVHFPVDP